MPPPTSAASAVRAVRRRPLSPRRFRPILDAMGGPPETQPSIPQAFAGLLASAAGVDAALSTAAGPIARHRFPLTPDGFERLAAWLQDGGARKAALVQGALAWPWQAERARRLSRSGPLDLAYWLEHQGPRALETVADEAAWQPVLLALRERFTVFLVRPQATGGAYPVPAGRNAAAALAARLAAGDYIAEYPKAALDRLIDDLADANPQALEECLWFFARESRGYWHNRARAKIARRLKHCPLAPPQRHELAQVIAGRLTRGAFTEQFKDQLHLLLRLDPAAAAQAGLAAKQSPLAHVRRYGEWLADRAV